MPAYNERDTIEKIVARVLARPEVDELVIVDDGSTDGTREILEKLAPSDTRIRVVLHERNAGKGAALRTGFRHVTSAYVVIQDADEEYDPDEYPVLLRPVLTGKADVVFGSRFLSAGERRVLYFRHSVGNRLLTLASNVMTNLNLSDMETCYKLFRKSVLDTITIEESRFGFEPEITAKVAAGNWRVFEVGISYYGRSYDEGKKIGWRDGVRAMYCVFRYSSLGKMLHLPRLSN